MTHGGSDMTQQKNESDRKFRNDHNTTAAKNPEKIEIVPGVPGALNVLRNSEKKPSKRTDDARNFILDNTVVIWKEKRQWKTEKQKNSKLSK